MEWKTSITQQYINPKKTAQNEKKRENFSQPFSLLSEFSFPVKQQRPMPSPKQETREIIIMVHQFLKEKKLDESVHMLEKDSGIYFDMNYFESLVRNGDWAKVEEYLSGFIKGGENTRSTAILLEIRRQKFLEALYIHGRAKAVAILTEDLRDFSKYVGEGTYKGLTHLLTLESYREPNEYYRDIETARGLLLELVKKLIRENPVFYGKLEFPTLMKSRLVSLMNQSLNWQHLHRKNAKPRPEIKTLFVDHNCEEPDGVLAQYISANPGKSGGWDLSKNADNLPISATCNMTDITEESQLRSLQLPDHLLSVKVVRLLYTKYGLGIIALTNNAVHKLWKSKLNATGQATASMSLQLHQPRSGIIMTNDLRETKPEEAVPCLAISKNDRNVVSASGGNISIFNIETFKVITTFMPPPPAATCVVYNPADNNIVAVGMEDSSIRIHNVAEDRVICTLLGHQKRVTGLAFSSGSHILVSSGAAQLCVWCAREWTMKVSSFLKIPRKYAKEPLAQVRVQLDGLSTVLAVHESQIAIYYLPMEMERTSQWVAAGKSNGAITDATYSSDRRQVYASFKDGSVGVFGAIKLTLYCRINPSSYMPYTIPSLKVYPVAIAAHPCKANQFAIGLSDGRVYVLEPLAWQVTWGCDEVL